MGYYFGLRARCLSDEFKKKYATTAMSLPPDWSAGKKKQKNVTSADLCVWRAREAGNAVRHTHRLNLRLGGSVVVTVAVVVLLQLRANSHTLKHRRADSSRPLERSDRPCVCISAKGGVVLSHAGVTIQHTEITNWQ